MRKTLLVAVAIALTACNQAAPPSAEPTVDQAAPSVATPEPAPVQATSNPEFPAEFEPSFPYKIRSKKSEETADGVLRKLVIEFKAGDVLEVDRQLEQLLVAKGYRRYKNFPQGDAVVGDYGKDGHRVTTTTTPSNGQLQLDPDSLGTVYFVWKQ